MLRRWRKRTQGGAPLPVYEYGVGRVHRTRKSAWLSQPLTHAGSMAPPAALPAEKGRNVLIPTARLLTYTAIVIIAAVLSAYVLGFRRARRKYEVLTVFQVDPETGHSHLMVEAGSKCFIRFDPAPSMNMTKTGDPGPLKATITREVRPEWDEEEQ